MENPVFDLELWGRDWRSRERERDGRENFIQICINFSYTYRIVVCDSIYLSSIALKYLHIYIERFERSC